MVAPTVENLPAMQETWVLSLGWEDLLEKGMATYSSILEFHGLGAPVVVAHGLSSCGWWALELGLNSCRAQAQLLYVMWDLPVPGIKPMSLTLAGGFLITGP